MAKKETVFSLSAQIRDNFGKGASRRDRQNDRIPAVVYGKDQAPLHVSLDHHTASLALRVPYVTINLELDGKKFVVAPREIQKDPIKPIYKHVDLVVLNDKEQKERLELAKKARESAKKDSIASVKTKKMKSGGKQMIKRADGSYSQRGLWDNIRANKGSGKKPTAAMLKQEKKIKAQSKKK